MKLVFALFLTLAGLTGPATVRAQALDLPDGKYASVSAYLTGTWKWERMEPRQTMTMTFDRDGNLFFHNFTIGLQVYCRYTATAQRFDVTVNRTCDSTGANCQTSDPPAKVDRPLTPVSANVFMSADERWERQK